MKIKHEHYYFFIAAIILILVLIGLVFAILTTKPEGDVSTPEPIPTLTMISPTPKIDPPVKYEDGSFRKLVNKLENRISLSEQDQIAKEKILSLLPANSQSGVLYNSPLIRIDYTAGIDIFQVEILTTSIDDAKNEGVLWFRDQGISEEGICDLPVDFYLNWDIANQLRGSYITFNPLAEGC